MTSVQQPRPAAPRPAVPVPAARNRAAPEVPYVGRELAWLEFNARVLEEALDERVPLLERLKFLSIFSSNLDEFFMVRVAGLYRQIDAGIEQGGPDGLSPRAMLDVVLRRLHELVERQHSCFDHDVAPKLARAGVRILTSADLDVDQKDELARHFRRTILPVVTPLAIDPGHPFPHLANRNIFLAVTLRARSDEDAFPTSDLAIVHLPSSIIPRFIRLRSRPGEYAYIPLEEAIRAHAAEVFAGYDVLGCYAMRVTRDADLPVNDETSVDLLKTIEDGLWRRRKGAALRLQFEARTPPGIPRKIADALELVEQDLFPIQGLIAFSDLIQVYGDVDLPQLKDPPFVPQRIPTLEQEGSIFDAIRKGEVLLHHPYQSFDYVVRFLRDAASDPHVLAVKMTLYRVGGASPIVEALRLAARNGKQVAVLMELKARFEEQANIDWARALEEAGAHVIYGIPGLKTHAKACLVVRREPSGVRRYVHLGTGNYNAKTALLYTDFGMFSGRDDLCEDVAAVFNLITGYCRPSEFRHLTIAPTDLRKRFVELIRRERAHAAAGRPARITAKMNGLEDREIIDELYAASKDGVEIDLIVRGICCLRPGVPGLSERIRVRRIVDRFLEHARVLRVENGGAPEFFLTSADWMPRNLDRRIEIMWPVLDAALRKEIERILLVQLADDSKARMIGPEGEGLPRKPEPGRLRAQEALLAPPQQQGAPGHAGPG